MSLSVLRGGGSRKLQLDDPSLSPIIAAWVRSLAPNLERMDLTRLLTVSSVIES